MQTTYRAVLRGDCLEWTDDAPSIEQGQPVSVTVTIVGTNDTPTLPAQGPRMAGILAQIAGLQERSDNDDPAAWERDIRRDRMLPGRDS